MKNIITNIVGSLLFFLSVGLFTYQDLSIIKFLTLTMLAGVLVYFDNKGIKSIIRKGVKKYF